MKHRATKQFWKLFQNLPLDVQTQARKQYALLLQDSFYPFVRLKPVGKVWSARVNDDVRVLAFKQNDTLVWFWIGSHEAYDKIIPRL